MTARAIVTIPTPMIGTFKGMSTRLPDCLKNTETPNSKAIKPPKVTR